MEPTGIDANLAQYLDAKFNALKSDLAKKKVQINNDKLAKRIKTTHLFKKKGCEMQYNFNDEIQPKT